MATVDDAIEALTDPENRVRLGVPKRYAANDLALMDGDRIAAHLKERGASDDEVADLMAEAVARVNGRDDSHWLNTNSRGPSRAKPQRIHVIAVPTDRLRERG
jgi:hypothetical protein